MSYKRRIFFIVVSLFLSAGLSLFNCQVANGQQKDALNDFKVSIPTQMLPIPVPLKPGETPGFKIRGMKGYNWTPQQYLEEIPVLAKYNGNFLMNCYLSMFSVKEKPVYRYGTFLDSIENNWWQPIPEEKKRSYEKVFETCRDHDIMFCFAMNPQLFSEHPLDPNSDKDFDLLLQHYLWAQKNGVKWFSVCLDDVREGEVSISANEHAVLVNRLFSYLRKNDPEAQMIFCPTWYWGDGTDPEHRPYLETLASKLNPEVYIFWTGPFVVPKHINVKDAQSYRDVVKHRIILWENYPVNDNHATMHLGPIIGRDPDLGKVIDGYMVNPSGRQNRINRIPLITCMDYAYNPGAYNPNRSIGQAILQMAQTPDEQQVLARLVEAYPGNLIFKKDTSDHAWAGLNPVRERFKYICASMSSANEVDNYIGSLQELQSRFNKLFSDKFPDAEAIIRNDIIWMKQNTASVLKKISDPVLRIRLLPPGKDNPRNSEGDFIKLNDGRILFVYTHFTTGSGDFAQACLAGRYSADGGKTWTNEDVIVLPNEGMTNIMSVSLLRLKNNSIALFYLRKNSDKDCRLFMRISKDEAHSWSKPILCQKNMIGYFVVNNDRVIQLKNGRLIAPASLHNTPEQNKYDNFGDIMCYYSDNNGRTWKRSKTTLRNKIVMLQEPGVVELEDGRILMFCRTNSGSQYFSFSSDQGISWSDFQPSDIISPLSPASVKRIPSTGDLLLVWNNTKGSPVDMGKRTPLNIAISKDNGNTWVNTKTIETNPDGWYCYTAIEFIDDQVLLAYCAGDRKTGNGLETLQISRFPVSWLYKKETTAELISSRMIWDKAPHNAFTDLIRYKDLWYCTFREGEKHVGGNGKIRVISSRDGEKWDSVALFEREGVDLRDPKLCITPDNRLMLHIGASIYVDGKLKGFRPSVVFMDETNKWSDMTDINITEKWPWKPFWYNHTVYCVAYSDSVILFKSQNGFDYKMICKFSLDGQPNEAAFCALPSDTLMILIRRDKGNRHAMIGKAAYPYNQWTWKETDWSVGGPALINIPGKGIFGSGRCTIDGIPRTVVGKVDQEGFTPLLALPSGGDCSYPGMVYLDGVLWMSYYSSHEGKTSIYLSKIKL